MLTIFVISIHSLELAVVMFSIAIGYTNWGIVWGFFGHPDHCVGAFGVPFTGDRMSQHLLQFISFMLDLLTSFLHGFDRFVINYALETKSLCSNELYAESNGTKCLQTPNGKINIFQNSTLPKKMSLPFVRNRSIQSAFFVRRRWTSLRERYPCCIYYLWTCMDFYDCCIYFEENR